MSDIVVTNKLADAMREAIRDASLKGETLKQFGDLAAKVEELTQSIGYHQRQSDQHRRETDTQSAKIRSLEKEVEAIAAREHVVKLREDNCNEFEKREAVAVARGNAYATMFEGMFKNTTFRKETIKSISMGYDGTGGPQVPVGEEITETETEE